MRTPPPTVWPPVKLVREMVGGTTSFIKGVESVWALPLGSTDETVRLRLPAEAAVKLSVVLQVPFTQLAVPVAAPEKTMSELPLTQVPLAETDATLFALT